MTKLKMILWGIFGLYIMGSFPLAYAQNPDPDGSSKIHGQRIQEIYNQLNLTDDQKKQLESNKQDHRAKMAMERQAMKTNKEALQQELMKPELDMAKVNAIHSQIKSLQSQMEDEKLASILAVRTILTPEQFSNFVNLMHRHKPEHEE